MKLFVTLPISSIWTWWRDRKARKLAEENERIRQVSHAYAMATEARRERLRRLLAENEGPFPPKAVLVERAPLVWEDREPLSPVGWGDKTLDGTGTGLVRGGDPPSMTDITMLGGSVPKRRKLT